MKRFLLGSALCLSAVPLMAATASGSPNTASTVLGYTSGTLPNGYTSYNNPSAALGPIQSDTSGGYGPDPFLPPWDNSQLVIVGAGGHLTLQMAHPVSGSGMLGVFTNVGITNISTTVGSQPQASNPAATFSPFPEAIVSVGNGGPMVTLNGGNPIIFEKPTNYYTDSPISVQSGPGYNYLQSSPGTHPADWTQPFLGNLASFNGETYAQMVATLDGSAGGSWMNLALASTGLSQVDVVEFSVPAGATYNMILDSVAAAATYWNGNDGTGLADNSGYWDTSTNNWSNAASGGTASAWSNVDIASFGAGGNLPVTVTIDQTGIIAEGITFNVMGTGGFYTIAANSGDNLTLSTATITMNANATISSPIVQSGTLTITGTGVLTLSGDTSGLTGSITNNAALIFAQSANSSLSGVISGSGTVMENGSSGTTLTLSGVNTYTGGTTVTSGTLNLTGSLAATGNLTVNGGTFAVANGTGQTVAALEGTGGTISLMAAADNLTVSNGGTFAGAVTGLGGLTLSGGMLTLSGANTYAGVTTISSGTLEFTDSTSGLAGNVLDNSELVFDQASASTLSGVISSGGTVTQSGSSILTISGNNTYTGGTTIDSGTLSISSDSNLGATTGGITLNGGTLDYTGGGGLIANAMNVTGSSTTSVLENSGSGMETLTGAITNSTAGNTLAFSGGTFNLNEVGSGSGTFQIGDAPSTVIVSNPNAFGSGAILLTTGSTLETTNVVSNTGAAIGITGGSYTQQAGSTLSLVANSQSIYDSIQLGGGAASLNGKLNLIFSGFTPRKGQRYVVIGTTGTVAGNFSSVSLIGAPVTMQGLPSFVSGTGEEIYIAPLYFILTGFTPNQVAVATYLNNNAVSPNTPAAITNGLNYISSLPQSQQGNYLNELTPQAYSQLQDQAIQNNTFLAQEVFGQVQTAFLDGGFNTSGLTLLKTNDQNPFAVSMDAAMQSAQQQAKNSTVYMDDPGLPTPIFMPGAGTVVYPRGASPKRFSGFVIGTVTLGQLPQQDSGVTQNFTTGGVLAGIDYRWNRHLLVGALFNYGYTGGTQDNVGSRQQSSSYTPGVFAGYKLGGFYADGLMSYTYNSYKINRNINLPGSSSTATGKPDSNEYDINALAGYYFSVAQGFKIGPAAGVGFTQVNTSGFSETGSPFDLSASKQHADSLRSLLGMQGLYTCHPFGDPLPISISFNAFWQHEYLDSSRGITSSFTQLGGGSFLFNTTGPSRDSALVGLGVNGYIAKQVSLFVNYETQVGTNSQINQTVMAGVAVDF